MRILNFGSLNIDTTYYVNHIAQPGETLSADRVEVSVGGKGLNQTAALARGGARVWHAGLIGEDGTFLKKFLEDMGADTEFVRTTDCRTGSAMIQVDERGENCIVLYGGANQGMTKAYIDDVLRHLGSGDWLVLQNEINLLSYIIDTACERGMKIALNPSPFNDKLNFCDLHKCAMLLVNRVEAQQMTGEEEAPEALHRLLEMYPDMKVVLTVGKNGAYYGDRSGILLQRSENVKVVDTTGAGDTFTGFFLARFIETGDIKTAMRYGTAAAAISVTRKGAAQSMPTLEEIEIQPA